jgi:hypothetical protein
LVDLDRLERVLIQAALERRPLTYGQLLAYFGWKVTRITVSALCRDLGKLKERRAPEGRPELACLVVRRSDGLPGEGYFASLRREGAYAGPSVGPTAEAFLRARQARACDWAEEQVPAAVTDGEQQAAAVGRAPQPEGARPVGKLSATTARPTPRAAGRSASRGR